jgi:hypothetical protein
MQFSTITTHDFNCSTQSIKSDNHYGSLIFMLMDSCTTLTNIVID